ncbi:hypothetical protein E2C01_085967 [Portunus trituberculatus]|uniref:Uncharacterized protein n=1 Tax=Portunus trituberculatus TaxID=210409 RepID=A0A5B7J813_PORTR|nr:hypothetical protein [Portunus trituberculatus]
MHELAHRPRFVTGPSSPGKCKKGKCKPASCGRQVVSSAARHVSSLRETRAFKIVGVARFFIEGTVIFRNVRLSENRRAVSRAGEEPFSRLPRAASASRRP